MAGLKALKRGKAHLPLALGSLSPFLLLVLFVALAPALATRASGAEQTAYPPASKVEKNSNPAKASEPVISALKPAPVMAKELPAVFQKPVPSSISDLRAVQQRVTELVKRVSGAVVDVQIGNGSGSGVIISADGLVLTAGHVCGSANRDARFTFPDGKTAHGKTLGVDRDSDAGLIRITEAGPWPHVAVGELDQAHLGDWVIAMGNPGGFDAKRSLVVRLGRIIQLAPGAIQTDCTISPGDSGGPLFDMYGRVIGIHSYISTSMADNFHVPITKFYESWEQLVHGEQPLLVRGQVGATTVDDDGCRFSAVEENGPAYKAGLRVGDVVLRVDGRDIKAAATFQRWLAEAEPGETLSLEVKRGAQTLTLEMKLDVPAKKN